MRKQASIIAAVLALTACGGTGATDGVDGEVSETVSSAPETTSSAAPLVSDPPESVEEPAEEPTVSLGAIKINTCKIGEYGVEITGVVTNTLSEVADIMGTIEITNPAGDRIDEAGVIESAVKPGQKVKFTAGGLEDPSGLGTKKIACSVLSVEGYPSS